jgi:hypothetical protein
MKFNFYSKSIVSSVFILILSAFVCQAQALFEYDEISEHYDGGLKRVSSDGRFGFIDFEGNEVIPLKYEDAFNFTNGLAPVKLDGKWGYIDVAGNEITPFKYDEAINFQNSADIAPVIIGKYYGFIDKTGKEVTPIKYTVDSRYFRSEVPRFSGTTLRANERYNDFQEIMKYTISVTPELMNKRTGKAYHPRFAEFESYYEFHEGMAVVRAECPDCEVIKWKELYPPVRFGFVNSSGQEIIPPIYEAVSTFGHCWTHGWVATGNHPDYGRVILDIQGNIYRISDKYVGDHNSKRLKKELEKGSKKATDMAVKAMRELEITLGKKPDCD